MKLRTAEGKPTYTLYSLGLGAAWIMVWAVVLLKYNDRKETFFLVFLGFVIGWVSASIARLVYPPPKHWSNG